MRSGQFIKYSFYPKKKQEKEFLSLSGSMSSFDIQYSVRLDRHDYVYRY